MCHKETSPLVGFEVFGFVLISFVKGDAIPRTL